MGVTGAFPERKQIAAMTANMLLEVKAVHFNAADPFILTSGSASPVYVDCRRLISFVRVRRALMDFAVSTIQRDAGFDQFDAVAGGETAGIPFAAWMADLLMLPMQYVRKKPKGFGRNARIEGVVEAGQRVLLVEDMASDGRSKVGFCDALRAAGAIVDHVFVLFYYDIFPDAAQILQDAGIEMHYLATWWDVLDAARSGDRFDDATLREVASYFDDPRGWSAAHGGADTG